MEFSFITDDLSRGINTWEPLLLGLSKEVIHERKNSQGRSIKQILGHMIDSVSNNTHRIIHLQYGSNPLVFPNYATQGNNDRWINIQNYQDEDWTDLVNLWKYSHLHLIHVIKNVAPEKLNHEWISGSDHGNVSLRTMIIDFLRHFNLHLNEIKDLIKKDAF